MHADGGSGSSPCDKSSFTATNSGTQSVASAYEQLLFATAAYSPSRAQESPTMSNVRSGAVVYPAMDAAQYTFTQLVGRYLGLLSKQALLTCLQRMHAYVRSSDGMFHACSLHVAL